MIWPTVSQAEGRKLNHNSHPWVFRYWSANFILIITITLVVKENIGIVGKPAHISKAI